MLVALLIVAVDSLDGGVDLDWNENEGDSDSPENMDTGRWKRNVTLDPVLVKPLLIFTI